MIAAHSSPVMVQIEGSPLLAAADAVTILEQIEGSLVYLDTVGTKLNGYYRFDLEGQTVAEMFIAVTDNRGLTLEQGGKESEIKKTWSSLPFNESARFLGGDQPLAVGVGRYEDTDMDDGYVDVNGYSKPLVAPVVVVKQTQTESQAEPQNHKQT